MPVLDLTVASSAPLSVRRFSVHEAVSSLFTVSLVARCPDPDIDLEAIVGQPASFRAVTGYKFALLGGARLWTGVCQHIEQVKGIVPQPGETPLSTYSLRIVPNLWLLTQRQNDRIFQHLAIPDIIDKLLQEWNITPVWDIDRAQYPKLEYKVQYDETDYAFFCRLLEEAGIAYTFPDNDQQGSKLTLSDKLHKNPLRAAPPIHYVDNPSQSAEFEFVSDVRLSHEVRPGALTYRDYDFRNPAFALFGEAPKAPAPEDQLEHYQYFPGAFLIETGKGGGTPVADDKGVARYDQPFGKGRAERTLLAARMGKRAISFDANTIDLWPGAVFAVDRHPHPDLDSSKQLLVIEFSAQGTPDGEWTMSGRAVFAEDPYRPPIVTPKPQVYGVQSATVVGPSGQEIHTDEFGRIRVQFPWDREGKKDDNSSCWIRVSQGWAGTGYGVFILPRIGQEVLVGFLSGDPDQPMVVGRVFNAIQPVPYKLPESKTISTWKSDSSLGGGGFNEIKFEDKKGDELVYIQAEKDLRHLVKLDETITVGSNREKSVGVNETDTTGVNRTEVTGANRTETTGANRTTVIGANRYKRVKGGEHQRTEGSRQLLVGKDHHFVTKGKKRERIEEDVHLWVKGKRSEKIDGTQSLTVVVDYQEKVGGNVAIAAGKEMYLHTNEVMVGEATDVTVKGPGGFLRIDASGVTISGTLVKINVGGGPGKGKESKPEEPEEPEV